MAFMARSRHGIAIYIALTLIICALVRRAVVKPLLSFGDSIKANQLFPVQGAGELQVLAETYNRVFTENEATHMVVKHQAEHDPADRPAQSRIVRQGPEAPQ